MIDRNIFAYTEPGADYPGFISINRRDGEIVVTVRAQGNGGNKQAELTLPQEKLDELIYSLRGARVNPLRGSGVKPPDADWLRQKTESDPETDCEASSLPSTGLNGADK